VYSQLEEHALWLFYALVVLMGQEVEDQALYLSGGVTIAGQSLVFVRQAVLWS
jgi:hypothetical protein